MINSFAMTTKRKIAYYLFLLCGAMSIVFGFLYLFNPTIMPYHKAAIGENYDQIEPMGLRILLHIMLKVAAAGFLSVGLALILMTAIPFRRGQNWARSAIWAVGFLSSSILFYVTVMVAEDTGAHTPWIANLSGMILLSACWFLAGKTDQP